MVLEPIIVAFDTRCIPSITPPSEDKEKGNEMIDEAEKEAKIEIKDGIKKEIRDEVDKLHKKD